MGFSAFAFFFKTEIIWSSCFVQIVCGQYEDLIVMTIVNSQTMRIYVTGVALMVCLHYGLIFTVVRAAWFITFYRYLFLLFLSVYCSFWFLNHRNIEKSHRY